MHIQKSIIEVNQFIYSQHIYLCTRSSMNRLLLIVRLSLKIIRLCEFYFFLSQKQIFETLNRHVQNVHERE